MGFWTGLAKVGLAAAAPFTGGATAAFIPAVDAISGVTSSLAQGAEKGRQQKNVAAASEAEFKARQAADVENALQNRAALELRQKQFGADEMRNNYRSALQAAFGKNVQDVAVNRPAGIPNISFAGGSRPSALGPEGRAAAALMFDKSMGSMRDGTSFTPLPGIERVAAPQYKNAGFFENLMGGIGTAGKGIKTAQDSRNEQENNSLLQSIMEGLRTNASAPSAPAASQAPRTNQGIWDSVRF